MSKLKAYAKVIRDIVSHQMCTSTIDPLASISSKVLHLVLHPDCPVCKTLIDEQKKKAPVPPSVLPG
jgi:hypothetical protein